MSHFDALINSCEQEALSFSGQILPHGALLAIDRSSGQITHASANCAQLLGATPAQLLEQNGKTWLQGRLRQVPVFPAMAGKRALMPESAQIEGRVLDLLISATSRYWLVEFELGGPASGISSPDPLTRSADLEQVQAALVEAVRQRIGYDRVMLYRFRPDWSGEVVAESVTKGHGSYLGLRFPATDIPANARALYARTPYRHIPDIESRPVSLVCGAGVTDREPLDLTWSDLRSVSPVHVQYLRNMQVAASYSISVLVNGRLWGLVACHHHQPRTVALVQRQASLVPVQEFAALVQQSEAGMQRQQHAAVERCMTALDREGPAAAGDEALAAGLRALAAPLLQLMNADAGVLAVGDRVLVFAGVVDSAAARALHLWAGQQREKMLALDHLPEALQQVDAPLPFCGVLAQPVPFRLQGRALSCYWLRGEEVEEVAWAGNPDKPIERSDDGQRFSPRFSFEKWVGVRRGHALPWSEADRFSARLFASRLGQWLAQLPPSTLA